MSCRAFLGESESDPEGGKEQNKMAGRSEEGAEERDHTTLIIRKLEIGGFDTPIATNALGYSTTGLLQNILNTCAEERLRHGPANHDLIDDATPPDEKRGGKGMQLIGIPYHAGFIQKDGEGESLFLDKRRDSGRVVLISHVDCKDCEALVFVFFVHC